MTNSPSFTLVFGPFSLEFPQRLLLRQGAAVRLGKRATDILAALVQAPGQLLGRDALLALVWPNSVVDEGALRVHLSSLRKALGDGLDGMHYISNEPGRGYRFVAPVERSAQSVTHSHAADAPQHNLPGQISRVLGRDDIIVRLLAQLEARRCLTVSGPGGLGKTTVALAIAHRFVAAGGRAVFVDFAPLSDPARVAGALAAALGVAQAGADPLQEVIQALGQDTVLLLLDNCEHMVEALAPVAERLLRESSGAHLLATSREPLRAVGEWIHRLATLDAPAAGSEPDAEEAGAYAAVRLFVERATAVRPGFTLTAANLDAVCNICRSLDGIPLAIEFAAARAGQLEVTEIADKLDARFNLLTQGSGSALPRQQTLRATLDWSYDLLTPNAQTVLRHIALFRTSFDMAAMLAVAADEALDQRAVFDAAADLVAKSLLNCDLRSGQAQFRLLDTTRYYGIDRLAESAGAQAARRRHALYCTALFTESQDAWDGNAKRERRALHSLRIDDIRAALDWSFSAPGDAAIGIALVVASAHLWFELSIPTEFFKVAEQALALIGATQLNGSVMHIDLLTVYGGAHWPTCGPLKSMGTAYSAALEIARRHGDDTLVMRAAWGMWIERLLNGHYARSLDFCEEYHALALKSGVIGNISTATNMLALSHHFIGNAQLACEFIDETVRLDALPERQSHANAAQLDGNLSAQGTVALLRYLRGDFAQALGIAHATAEDTLAFDHDLTLCAIFSTGVIPSIIWSGELAVAARLTAALRERAQRCGMTYWDRWGEGYAALLDGTGMDLDAAAMMQVETFAGLGLASALDYLEARGRRFEQSWVQPELMRQHAERSAEPHGAAAIGELEIALQIARLQHCGLWQLRITLSLARAHCANGESVAAATALDALALLLQRHAGAPENADVAQALRFLHGARPAGTDAPAPR